MERIDKGIVNNSNNDNEIGPKSKFADRIYVFKPGSDEGFVFLNHNPSLEIQTLTGVLGEGVFLTGKIDEATWDDDINGEKVKPHNNSQATLTFSRKIKFDNNNDNTNSLKVYTIMVSEELFDDLQKQINEENSTQKNGMKKLDFHTKIIEYKDKLENNYNDEINNMLNEDYNEKIEIINNKITNTHK